MNAVLVVALVILIIAAIWCIAEVALTVRKVRPAITSVQEAVEEVKTKVNDIADQAQPVLAHVDEAVTSAQPALDGVNPLLEQATGAVGTLNSDLERIEGILKDASQISGAASNATVAVQAATSSIANRVLGRLGHARSDPANTAQIPQALTTADTKVAGLGSAAIEADDEQTDVQPSSEEHDVVAEQAKVIRTDKGYFTYPTDKKGE